MKAKVTFTQRARQYLEEIYLYVAEKGGENSAEKLVGGIHTCCIGLGDFPDIGRPREDLGAGMRTHTYHRKATILYRVEGNSVVIGAIYYGGRSLGNDASIDWEEI